MVLIDFWPLASFFKKKDRQPEKPCSSIQTSSLSVGYIHSVSGRSNFLKSCRMYSMPSCYANLCRISVDPPMIYVLLYQVLEGLWDQTGYVEACGKLELFFAGTFMYCNVVTLPKFMTLLVLIFRCAQILHEKAISEMCQYDSKLRAFEDLLCCYALYLYFPTCLQCFFTTSPGTYHMIAIAECESQLKRWPTEKHQFRPNREVTNPKKLGSGGGHLGICSSVHNWCMAVGWGFLGDEDS